MYTLSFGPYMKLFGNEAEKIGYSHQMKDEFIKKVKDNIDFYVMSFHIGIGANPI